MQFVTKYSKYIYIQIYILYIGKKKFRNLSLFIQNFIVFIFNTKRKITCV